MTVRLGILLSYVLFTALTRWTLRELRPRYLESIEESLADSATVLASWVAQEMDDGELDSERLAAAFNRVRDHRMDARIYSRIKTSVDMGVYITDEHGVVVFDSRIPSAVGQDYSQWRDVLLTLQGRYGARSTKDDPLDEQASVLYVAAPLWVGDRIAGVLTVSKPTRSINEYIHLASRKVVRAGVAAGLAVVAVGILVSWLLTHPLRVLTAHARAVRDGRREGPGRPPGLGAVREIRELADAYEEMREVLEGRRTVERYVQNLTHEIKSPLSSIQGASELLEEDMPPEQRDRFLRNIRSESARIGAIVDRLLKLASVERLGRLDEPGPVELSGLLEKCRHDLEPQGAHKRLRWEEDSEPEVWITGDEFLLRQTLANVLQNALDFSPQGGRIRVSCSRDGGWAKVVVEDEGPGIPDYAVEKVYERFFSLPRPDTQQKSSGLGLSFVAEVVKLHGAEVVLTNRPERGVRAVLRFPLR